MKVIPLLFALNITYYCYGVDVELIESDNKSVLENTNKQKPINSNKNLEYNESNKGKTIEDIFGKIRKIKIVKNQINKINLSNDEIVKKIKVRISKSICVGNNKNPWSKAPWLVGIIELEDGSIINAEILLSGIVMGNYLFDLKIENAPNK